MSTMVRVVAAGLMTGGVCALLAPILIKELYSQLDDVRLIQAYAGAIE